MLRTRLPQACAVIALVFACDGSSTSVPAAAPPDPPASAGLAPDAPAEEALDVYAYAQAGKRDPFRSLDEGPEQSSCAPDSTELRCWTLDQLKLIALVRGGAPAAMVEDPRGVGHTLRRGDVVGRSYARVLAIGEGELVVREEWLDSIGRRQKRDVSIRLVNSRSAAPNPT